MHIANIWRYPVKSLRGEPLEEAEVLSAGINGDRNVVVVSRSRQKVITARTHPHLLGLHGGTEPATGLPTVNGYSWNTEEARMLVEEAAGEPIELVFVSGTERFDILPILVATDGAIRELGVDQRRLRPNIVVADAPGRSERSWPGRYLRVGATVLYAAQLRSRCVMTTYDADTQEQDRSVLFRIVREFEGKIALDCSVQRAGAIRVGDAVELID